MRVEGSEVTLKKSPLGGYDVHVADEAAPIGRVFRSRYYLGTRGSGEITLWDGEMPGVPDRALSMRETRTKAVEAVVRRWLRR